MKKLTTLFGLFAFLFVLAACGTAAPAASEAPAASSGDGAASDAAASETATTEKPEIIKVGVVGEDTDVWKMCLPVLKPAKASKRSWCVSPNIPSQTTRW